ncbi:MAG: HlyD family efflux transporter periplasmic adaptor subunit [Alicycliphilus sp.]|uniref:HlyD family efflux transporter periplasmic adaptor subunit n=1 Tax=Diaphorobacter limosus TaxID=3036128 RepID=A0ABZ0J7A6_9BURK|nr:HlyD family efflux transporter periplasmic adaptor subunit [Diaphorobacter sp. Y-1]MBP7329990.1 HlyD family efflux transporter periplasmic adaptor subunit [Alicycliphilus sp.]MBP8138087.1 HlyD family efflux transporter periplasmic adaptor subunit [Alicycliphilus sp.]TXJ11324.1 MAG: HlyD family efflux transporter periplasmic adaptor subunit [Alicycliphilus sp.]WOO32718.1 HlyD family efflux transporter periplasmic adaptor subunit [Diaphorobacter sp. Y-1]HRM50283.1 HlyD family efflux transport
MSRQTKYLNALALACALSLPLFVQAHEGHDDAPPALSGDSPRRQSDGSVFIPKSAQRQLGLRTLAVAAGEHARAFELAGTVVMDPNAGGKVQAALAGRLEAGPQGLPLPGQSVKKGQVLAYVVPTAGALERSGQLAQQAELRAAKELAQRRLARLRELADTVARKDIEAAESELQSLTARLAAVGAGLQQRDALVAPVSGVIASSNAVAGQVLDAREQVFEVVDPARLRIEALAYDPAQAQDVAGASLALPGGQSVPLRFLGAARSLREQALPLSFAGDAQALSQLALGQSVRLVVQTRSRVAGLQVPLAALQKNPSNQAIVWVKTGPEQYAPRVVRIQPLDGVHVAVTDGLQPGERVATQGASLLNQIR